MHSDSRSESSVAGVEGMVGGGEGVVAGGVVV